MDIVPERDTKDDDDSGFGMHYDKYEYDPLVPPRVPTPFGIGEGMGIGMFDPAMIMEQSERYLALFSGEFSGVVYRVSDAYLGIRDWEGLDAIGSCAIRCV